MTELEIVNRIWQRAYLDEKEEHVKLITDYGKSERNKAVDEVVMMLKEKGFNEYLIMTIESFYMNFKK